MVFDEVKQPQYALIRLCAEGMKGTLMQLRTQMVGLLLALLVTLPICSWAQEKTTRVRVLRDGQPVAGAPVVVLLHHRPNQLRKQLGEALDWDQGRFLRQALARSDQDGLISIKRFQGAMVALAWVGTEFGVATAEVDDGLVHELAIAPDHDLKVKVTDDAGLPAPKVDLLYARSRHWHTGLERLYTTDDLGSVTIRHAQLAFLCLDGSVTLLPKAAHAYCAVILRGLVENGGVKHDLASVDPLPEQVDLVLDELAVLDLTAVDADGKTFTEDFGAEVKLTGIVMPMDHVELHGGRRTILVKSGVEIQFGVRYREWERPTITRVEPLKAGERRKVQIQLPKSKIPAQFSVRVLGPDGDPLRGTVVAGFVTVSSSEPSSEEEREHPRDIGSSKTDEDGVLMLPGLTWYAEVSELEGGNLTSLAIEVPGTDGPLGAGFELPSPMPKDDHHFGDMRLLSLPLAAAGRVTDSEGMPLVDVGIRLYLESESTDLFGYGEEFIPRAWARTDANGRFAFVANSRTPESFHLQFELDRYVTTTIKNVPAGTTSIGIKLRQGNAIVLNAPRLDILDSDYLPFFLVPKNVDSSAFEGDARVVNGSLGLKGSPRLRGSVSGTDAIVWNQIPPGEYFIEARAAGSPEPLVRIGGIVAKESDVTYARLPKGFAIPERFAMVSIDFVEGSEVHENGYVVVFAGRREGDEARRPWRFHAHSGRITTARPIPVLAGVALPFGQDFASYFVTAGGKEKEEVKVEQSVTLKLDDLAKLGDDARLSTTFRLTLLECKVPEFGDLNPGDLFDLSKRAQFVHEFGVCVPGPGRYRIDLGIEAEGAKFETLSSTEFTVEQGEKGPLEIPLENLEAIRSALGDALR